MTSQILHAKLALGSRSPAIASRHADRLERLGFEIENVSGRGVSFKGPAELFEQVFQAPVSTADNQAHFVSDPVVPDEISDQVDSVYFPSKPTFFE